MFSSTLQSSSDSAFETFFLKAFLTLLISEMLEFYYLSLLVNADGLLFSVTLLEFDLFMLNGLNRPALNLKSL
jgi:hypothetical protein